MLNTKLIAVEGDDGVGKTTLAKNIISLLALNRKTAIHIAPGNLPDFATELRTLYTSESFKDVSDDVRVLMFSSYLLNIWEQAIAPQWGKHDYIVIDRTWMSTQAYQHESKVLPLITTYLQDKMPIDVLVYLRTKGSLGIERIKKQRKTALDTIEAASTESVIAKRTCVYDRLTEESTAAVVMSIDARLSSLEIVGHFSERLSEVLALTKD